MDRFIKKLPDEYIEIKKDSLPYEFTTDGRYFYYITDNTYDNNVRCTIFDRLYDENNGKGRILGKAEEKFILDFPVFWQYTENYDGRRNLEFPLYDLVPRSIDLLEHDISLDNINEKILICLEPARGLIKLRNEKVVIDANIQFRLPSYEGTIQNVSSFNSFAMSVGADMT